MKVGFFGTRGVPASYSGFETLYERIGERLSKKFKIFVFNRWNYLRYPLKFYKGMKIITLPTIPQKHLDTIFHTFISFIFSLPLNLDVALICGVGNAPLLPLFNLKMKTIINVDGEDWRRKKWGKFSSFYLKRSSNFARKFAHIIIADSLDVYEMYKSPKTYYIPYGGIPNEDYDDNFHILSERFRIEPESFFLMVGRLVPENGMDKMIRAFKRAKDKGIIPSHFKLVVVGDAPYSSAYKKMLYSLAEGRDDIVFTGYLFSSSYISISKRAFCFVLCAEVGGTHPVLVEQMSIGNFIISFDTPSTREVLSDAGLFFKTEEELLEKIAMSFKEIRNDLKQKAKKRAEEYYSWDIIAKKYEEVLLKCK